MIYCVEDDSSIRELTGSYDAGRFELLTNRIESHYFFGGSVGTTFSDFEVELWNGVVLGMPS